MQKQFADRPAAATPTYGDALREAAARFPAAEGLVIDGERLDNAERLARAERALAALQASGCRQGDRIGIYMPNCAEYIDVVIGAMLGGIVPVTMNSRYLGEELVFVIRDSGIRLLVTTAAVDSIVNYRERVSSAMSSAMNLIEQAGESANTRLAEVVVVAGDSDDTTPHVDYDTWLARGGEVTFATVDTDDVALMMYTSGTTANPKGCLLSHRAIMGNAAAMAERWRMTSADRFWDPLPFFHMSTILPIAACLLSGATFVATRHFDAGAAVNCLSEERITIAFPAFPTLMTALINHPDYDPVALPALRLVNNVAPPDTLKAFQNALPAQARQVSAYGLTEAGGVVSFGSPDDDLEQRSTTCGKPFPGIDVGIFDPATEAELPPDTEGEIRIRGYCLLDAYHNAPEATAEAMRDGWLRTGDLGVLTTDGYIRYTGRLKDMLKVGGENVAALEIEALVNDHPDVVLSQVIGVPDEHLLEVPALFAQCHEGATASGQALVDYCRERISRFKVPRYVVFVTEWPMSATKIQKFRLKELDLGERYVV
ncbi:MAG: AMP-binding protein [Pseudomonadota bacterium]